MQFNNDSTWIIVSANINPYNNGLDNSLNTSRYKHMFWRGHSGVGLQVCKKNRNTCRLIRLRYKTRSVKVLSHNSHNALVRSIENSVKAVWAECTGVAIKHWTEHTCGVDKCMQTFVITWESHSSLCSWLSFRTGLSCWGLWATESDSKLQEKQPRLASNYNLLIVMKSQHNKSTYDWWSWPKRCADQLYFD